MFRFPLLNGLRVLDASRILAGPYCAQILADLGAEVIKLEKPGEGDDTRRWGPPFQGDFSAYFLSCNRNKRSLTLDLANPEGNRLFHQLLDRSDILIENFRSDSTEKLGLSSEQLLKSHPKLIIASITGYGRTGPMREVLGYDFAIQALSGLMSITGAASGEPAKVGVAVTDVLTGLHAAVGILACLHARQSTGHGYWVDFSLLDCAVASQVNVVQAFLSSGQIPKRQGNAHLQIVPYQLFSTSDGYLVLAVGNDRQWQHFCSAAELPELATDLRFATNPDRVRHREVLIPQLQNRFREWTTEQWIEKLAKYHVPHAPVQNYLQLFEMEQMQVRGMKQVVRDPDGNEVSLIGSPFQINGELMQSPQFPPKLGQHTDEILSELFQLSSEAIEKLRQEKIV